MLYNCEIRFDIGKRSEGYVDYCVIYRSKYCRLYCFRIIEFFLSIIVIIIEIMVCFVR